MTQKRPNILFLMPDQLRADFMGCYGADFARTPHLDALAARSTRFERCLSPNPICVPARASLLTGTTTLENGVMNNSSWLRPDFEACGVATWPALLGRAGYVTYGVGKMHFYPWDGSEGFDHRAIAEDKRQIGIADDYADDLAAMGQKKIHGRDMAGYFENGGACVSPLKAEQQVDAWCADRAIDYLATHDPSQPFAMMVGFPSPHCPYDPPAEIAAMFDPADMPASCPPTDASEKLLPWLIENMKNPWADIDYTDFSDPQKAAVRAHYSALIHLVDIAVGRILAALEEHGFAENTVIAFASDHGDFVGDFGMVCKNFFMEGSVHVPLILHEPGQAGERRSDTVTLSDLYPTFLRIAGVTPRQPLSFQDLADPVADRVIFGATHRGFMVERGRLKLARYFGGVVTLYNISNDPQEQNNLADDPAFASEHAALDGLLTDWQITQLQRGHVDKTIRFQADSKPGAGIAPGITDRGWSRPYPYNPFSETRK